MGERPAASPFLELSTRELLLRRPPIPGPLGHSPRVHAALDVSHPGVLLQGVDGLQDVLGSVLHLGKGCQASREYSVPRPPSPQRGL